VKSSAALRLHSRMRPRQRRRWSSPTENSYVHEVTVAPSLTRAGVRPGGRRSESRSRSFPSPRAGARGRGSTSSKALRLGAGKHREPVEHERPTEGGGPGTRASAARQEARRYSSQAGRRAGRWKGSHARRRRERVACRRGKRGAREGSARLAHKQAADAHQERAERVSCRGSPGGRSRWRWSTPTRSVSAKATPNEATTTERAAIDECERG
jgi:hypothetical protein